MPVESASEEKPTLQASERTRILQHQPAKNPRQRESQLNDAASADAK
jgi:hypothetical protein